LAGLTAAALQLARLPGSGHEALAYILYIGGLPEILSEIWVFTKNTEITTLKGFS
jgi:hypothetical protein